MEIDGEDIKFSDLDLVTQNRLIASTNISLNNKNEALEFENKSLIDEVDYLRGLDKIKDIESFKQANNKLKETNKNLEYALKERNRVIDELKDAIDRDLLNRYKRYLITLINTIRNKREELDLYEYKNKLTIRHRIEDKFLEKYPELKEEFIEIAKSFKKK